MELPAMAKEPWLKVRYLRCNVVSKKGGKDLIKMVSINRC